MKSIGSLVLLASSIFAAAAFSPSGAQSQTAPNDELSRRFVQTTTGTVKSYSADERIVLVAEDGSEVTMALDAGARVDDSIAEGGMVTVAWLTDSLGRRRVTSIAPVSPAPAGGASSSASSAPPSKAYAATEGGGMSTTPSGPMASTPAPPLSGTPRSRVTGAAGSTTPGMVPTPARTMPPGTGTTPGPAPDVTPGPPLRKTPPTGSI